jgi:hypothetical protein
MSPASPALYPFLTNFMQEMVFADYMNCVSGLILEESSPLAGGRVQRRVHPHGR